jgi:hypothetical protein
MAVSVASRNYNRPPRDRVPVVAGLPIATIRARLFDLHAHHLHNHRECPDCELHAALEAELKARDSVNHKMDSKQSEGTTR